MLERFSLILGEAVYRSFFSVMHFYLLGCHLNLKFTTLKSPFSIASRMSFYAYLYLKLTIKVKIDQEPLPAEFLSPKNLMHRQDLLGRSENYLQ